MKIEIIDDNERLSSHQDQLITNLLELAAEKLKLKSEVELDVSIVDNHTIRQLNREYRGKDQVTDVLSFALQEGGDSLDQMLMNEVNEDFDWTPHLGDIIISYDRAQEQALEYQHSLDRELGFLVVHGFLHLNGYDHQTLEDERQMFAIQEEVLTEYGLNR